MSTQFFCRVYRAGGATLLASCDADLLGKVFREGEAVLRVSEGYYGGEKVGPERLRSLLETADIISLVGEGCIGLAVEMGLAEWRFVKRVEGVPHLNIYRF